MFWTISTRICRGVEVRSRVVEVLTWRGRLCPGALAGRPPRSRAHLARRPSPPPPGRSFGNPRFLAPIVPARRPHACSRAEFAVAVGAASPARGGGAGILRMLFVQTERFFERFVAAHTATGFNPAAPALALRLGRLLLAAQSFRFASTLACWGQRRARCSGRSNPEP